MDERRAAILRAVVEGYIETAQPVGSAAVARDNDVNVSSATIRNEMVALEQDGFLVQPHTSAGRIPTDKGYRHFVDAMLPAPGPLDAARRHQVSTFFAKAHGALEDMLQSTSRMLSNLTDYAAVVVGPSRDEATVRSVQLVGLAPRTALVVAILDNGAVEKATLELSDDIGDERTSAATAHLSHHLVGSTLRGTDVPVSGDALLDDVCKSALNALRSAHSEEPSAVFVGGASRMAAAFDAVETVRSVLTTLEQQYVVVGLLRDVLDRGLSVSIGGEHNLEALSECSIVVYPYEVDGHPAGTIGVLGPTRMHYPEALAAVAVVSKRLGRHLTEG
ncbi:MAG: heat-inducible transcriptional repressor [Actinomycetota bacterium]|jgi:heat-inducible transcriptional repressor|nr:heat-inducible transcriptional repressor [Actinomycetota bacterium]